MNRNTIKNSNNTTKNQEKNIKNLKKIPRKLTYGFLQKVGIFFISINSGLRDIQNKKNEIKNKKQ